MSSSSSNHDIEALDRILMRLAMVEDDGVLAGILDKLLPKLLRKLSPLTAHVHPKIIEILQHLNRRIKSVASITLPVPALVAEFLSTEAGPMTRNFAMIYIQMGWSRVGTAVHQASLGPLLEGLHARPARHQSTVLGLLLQATSESTLMGGGRGNRKLDCIADVTGPADVALVLEFLLDILLYVPPSAKQVAAAAEAAAAAGGPVTTPPPPAPPPGMSVSGLARLAAAMGGVDMLRCQRSVCGAIVADQFPRAMVVRHLVAMVGHADHSIVTPASEMLRRTTANDIPPAAASDLFALFLGGAEDGRCAVSTHHRLIVVQLLCRSPIASPSLLGPAIQLTFQGLFGDDVASRMGGMRLRQSVLRFVHHVVETAPAAAVPSIAPVLWAALQRLLQQLPAFQRFYATEPAPVASSSSPAAGGGVGVPALLDDYEEHELNALSELLLTAVSKVARRAPQLFASHTHLVRLLFFVLGGDGTPAADQTVRASAQELLSQLCDTVARAGPSEALRGQLRTLLHEKAGHADKRVRFVVAHWSGAAGVFDFGDCTARYTCVRLAGDPAAEVRETAKASLELQRATTHGGGTGGGGAAAAATGHEHTEGHNESKVPGGEAPGGAIRVGGGGVESGTYPDFADWIAFLQDGPQGVEAVGTRVTRLQAPCITALLEFTTRCLCASAASAAAVGGGLTKASHEDEDGGGADTRVERDRAVLREYLHRHAGSTATGEVGPALCAQVRMIFFSLGVRGQEEGSTALHQGAAALLEMLVRAAPAVLGPHLALQAPASPTGMRCAPQTTRNGLSWCLPWVLCDTQRVREGMARVAGCVARHTSDAKLSLAALARLLDAARAVSSRVVHGRHGSVLGIGHVVAALHRRLVGSQGEANQTESESHRATVEAAIVEAVAVLGNVLGVDATAAAANPPTTNATTSSEAKEGAKAADETKVATTALSWKVLVQRAACSSYGVAALAGALVALDKGPLLNRLKALVQAKGSTQVESAVECMGAVCRGEPSNAAARTDTLDYLVTLHRQRSDSTQFVVGRTLGRILSSAPLMVQAVCRRIGEDVLGSCLHPVSRRAGVVWLVSILLYTRHTPEVRRCAAQVHGALLPLLGDRSQFVQECAAKGVSLAYALCDHDPSIQAGLIAALRTYMSWGQAAAHAGGVGTDQATVAAAAATTTTSSAHTHSLGADRTGQQSPHLALYRELCAVAALSGNADLTYLFMEMSCSHLLWEEELAEPFALGTARAAAWTTSGTSSALHAAAPVQDGTQVLPTSVSQDVRWSRAATGDTVVALIPALFRGRFDPDPRVSEAMRRVWKVLTARHRVGIAEHFERIMTYLLQALGAPGWKQRVSACLGVVALLRAQCLTHAQLNEWLCPLWTLALASLEDPKEAVSEAAAPLVRMLSKITVVLCAPHEETTAGGVSVTVPSEERKDIGGGAARKDVAARALAVMLPFLLEKGIESPNTEARGLCLQLLLEVVGGARAGGLLRPHAMHVVPAILALMGSVEPRELQYLQFHAHAGTVTDMGDQELEQLRIRLACQGPLHDALYLCLPELMPEDAPQLARTLARMLLHGVGLPTLCACSRVVRWWASAAGESAGLRLSASDAHVLLSALVSVRALGDRSATLRLEYAAAAAEVTARANAQTLAHVADRLAAVYCERGVGSTGDDPTSRTTCGEYAVRVAGRASQLAEGAGQPVLDRLLPLAFLARFDEETKSAEAWEKTWTDNTVSLASGLATFLDAVVARVLDGLQHTSWILRRQASKALHIMVVTVGDTELRSGAKGEAAAASSYREVLFRAGMAALARHKNAWRGKEDLLRAIIAVCRENRVVCPDVGSAAVGRCVEHFCAECRQTARGETQGDHGYRRAAVECVGQLAHVASELNTFSLVTAALDPILSLPPALVQGPITTTTTATTTTTTTGSTDGEAQWAAGGGNGAGGATGQVDLVLLARSIECLGQAWPRHDARTAPAVDEDDDMMSAGTSTAAAAATTTGAATQQATLCPLVHWLSQGLVSGQPWSVRLALVRCAQQVWTKLELQQDTCCDLDATGVGRAAVEGLARQLEDTKYSRVREAALETLSVLVGRQALAPARSCFLADGRRERIVEHCTRLLDDQEFQVVHRASELLRAVNNLPTEGGVKAD